MRPTSRLRRRLLCAGALAPLFGSRPASATPATVTVVTSYPDEFVARIEAAFEAAHPGQRLRVVWRSAADAADYLRQPGHGGADVYWLPSPRNFARLADQGIWQKLTVDREKLPKTIAGTALADPGEHYTASEVAGFGFAVDPAWFASQGMALPRDWPDLADPRLAGRIALPIPSRVGFAPPMVEIVLQAWGWDDGWALWSAIAGNAVPVERASTFVSDLVADGRQALGLSIDFFVNAAIANGKPLQFIYPAHTGLNPAHIAITRSAPNPEGARRFVDFVLSAQGQALLRHPDIRRLPVRPDAYAGTTGFNPFAAAPAFDAERARPRLALSSAIFDAMLIAPHAELSRLWQRIHRAEADGRDVATARRLLGMPPLDEAAANAPALQRQLTQDAAPPERLLADWRRLCASRRAQAARQLDGAGA